MRIPLRLSVDCFLPAPRAVAIIVVDTVDGFAAHFDGTVKGITGHFGYGLECLTDIFNGFRCRFGKTALLGLRID